MGGAWSKVHDREVGQGKRFGKLIRRFRRSFQEAE